MKSLISQLQSLAAHSPYATERVSSIVREVERLQDMFLRFAPLAKELGVPLQHLHILACCDSFPKPVEIDGQRCWDPYIVDAYLAAYFARYKVPDMFAEWKRTGIKSTGTGDCEYMDDVTEYTEAA